MRSPKKPAPRLPSGQAPTGTPLAQILREDKGLFAEFMARVLGLKLKPFHFEWLDLAEKHDRLLLLAPANHGKTTILSVLNVLHEIYRNPDLRVGVFTCVDPLAQSIVRQLKDLLRVPALQLAMGNLVPPRPKLWNEWEFVVERPSGFAGEKDATGFATGISGSAVGRRFDLIIADDVVDIDNVETEHAREAVRRRFNFIVEYCCTRNGRILVVGTRYHHADLYAELEAAGYHTKTWKALGEDGTALWPEHEDTDALEKMRNRDPAAFAARKQNEVMASGSQLIKPEWVDNCLDATRRLHAARESLGEHDRDLQIYQGVDLAISPSKRAAYFVILTVGFHPHLRYYVPLSFVRERCTFPEQLSHILSQYQAWQPIQIFVESNQYQLALADAAREAGAGLPVKEVYTTWTKNRLQEGIPRLASIVEQGALRIPCGDAGSKEFARLLCEELKGYPSTKYSDLMMALWFVVKQTRFTEQISPSFYRPTIARTMTPYGLRRWRTVHVPVTQQSS